MADRSYGILPNISAMIALHLQIFYLILMTVSH